MGGRATLRGLVYSACGQVDFVDLVDPVDGAAVDCLLRSGDERLADR